MDWVKLPLPLTRCNSGGSHLLTDRNRPRHRQQVVQHRHTDGNLGFLGRKTELPRENSSPSADRGMMWYSKGDIHQSEDRCHHAFSLAQGYPEEGGTQHQAGPVGEVRLAGLATGRGAGGGLHCVIALELFRESGCRVAPGWLRIVAS